MTNSWWCSNSYDAHLKRRKKARRKAGMKQNGQGKRAGKTSNNPTVRKKNRLLNNADNI